MSRSVANSRSSVLSFAARLESVSFGADLRCLAAFDIAMIIPQLRGHHDSVEGRVPAPNLGAIARFEPAGGSPRPTNPGAENGLEVSDPAECIPHRCFVFVRHKRTAPVGIFQAIRPTGPLVAPRPLRPPAGTLTMRVRHL